MIGNVPGNQGTTTDPEFQRVSRGAAQDTSEPRMPAALGARR